MGIGSVTGYAAQELPQTKASGTAKTADAASSAGAGPAAPSGPVDTVQLSAAAIKTLEGAQKISITAANVKAAEEAARASMPADLAASVEKFTPENIAAMEKWRNENSEYNSRLIDLVKNTLGIPENAGLAYSDTTRKAFEKLGAENGLFPPEMPPEVSAFWTPPAKEENPDAGYLQIAFGIGQGSAPASQGNVSIFYDPKGMSAGTGNQLTNLKDDSSTAQSLLSMLKAGPLGKELSAHGGWTPKDKANGYALTTGSGPDAKTLAFIMTNNKDSYAQEHASNIVGKLQELLKN